MMFFKREKPKSYLSNILAFNRSGELVPRRLASQFKFEYDTKTAQTIDLFRRFNVSEEMNRLTLKGSFNGDDGPDAA